MLISNTLKHLRITYQSWTFFVSKKPGTSTAWALTVYKNYGTSSNTFECAQGLEAVKGISVPQIPGKLAGVAYSWQFNLTASPISLSIFIVRTMEFNTLTFLNLRVEKREPGQLWAHHSDVGGDIQKTAWHGLHHLYRCLSHLQNPALLISVIKFEAFYKPQYSILIQFIHSRGQNICRPELTFLQLCTESVQYNGCWKMKWFPFVVTW